MVENTHYESDIDEDDSSSRPNQTDGEKNVFEVGDHVYTKCHDNVVIYTHHGIVVEVCKQEEGEDIGGGDKITIVDFYMPPTEETRQHEAGSDHCADQSNTNNMGISCMGGSSGGTNELISNIVGKCVGPGRLRRVELTTQAEKSEWQKHHYETNSDDGDTNNAATTSLVISRVNFLLSNPSMIPTYHVLKSNCECVAVWCKTGNWSTRQGLTALGIFTAIPTGAAVQLSTAGILSAIETTVVAIWPILLGIGAVAGGAVTGVSVYKTIQCRKFWKETTDKLNEEFCVRLVQNSMKAHKDTVSA